MSDSYNESAQREREQLQQRAQQERTRQAEEQALNVRRQQEMAAQRAAQDAARELARQYNTRALQIAPVSKYYSSSSFGAASNQSQALLNTQQHYAYEAIQRSREEAQRVQEAITRAGLQAQRVSPEEFRRRAEPIYTGAAGEDGSRIAAERDQIARREVERAVELAAAQRNTLAQQEASRSAAMAAAARDEILRREVLYRPVSTTGPQTDTARIDAERRENETATARSQSEALELGRRAEEDIERRQRELEERGIRRASEGGDRPHRELEEGERQQREIQDDELRRSQDATQRQQQEIQDSELRRSQDATQRQQQEIQDSELRRSQDATQRQHDLLEQNQGRRAAVGQQRPQGEIDEQRLFGDLDLPPDLPPMTLRPENFARTGPATQAAFPATETEPQKILSPESHLNVHLIGVSESEFEAVMQELRSGTDMSREIARRIDKGELPITLDRQRFTELDEGRATSKEIHVHAKGSARDIARHVVHEAVHQTDPLLRDPNASRSEIEANARIAALEFALHANGSVEDEADRAFLAALDEGRRRGMSTPAARELAKQAMIEKMEEDKTYYDIQPGRPGLGQRPSMAPRRRMRSAATNEPREAETGIQKEARELGADRPQRQPKSDKYFDYEGGERGSFFQFVKELKGHFDGLGGSRPAMDESILRKKTGEFLKEKGLLADYWKMLENHQKKMKAFEDNYPNARAGEAWRKLQGTDDEMKQFLNGKLGAKRPDLVELKLGDRAVDVTDISQKFGQEFHEFKTKVYKELLGDLFPGLKAGGLEYGGVGAQKSL
jgi:hypothetical protein